MKGFKTHTGEIISGKRLTDAQHAVADWYVHNAKSYPPKRCLCFTCNRGR